MENIKELSTGNCVEIEGGNCFEVGTEIIWFFKDIMRNLSFSKDLSGTPENYQI